MYVEEAIGMISGNELFEILGKKLIISTDIFKI
jgi:hypothetical protein